MLIYEHTGSLKTGFLIQKMLRNLIDKTTFTPQGLAWHDDDSLKSAGTLEPHFKKTTLANTTIFLKIQNCQIQSIST